MKKILAVALLIASVGAMPTVTPAFADSSNDHLCGPDAPEGYKRPGGYCDQIDNKGSMMEQNGCRYQIEANLVAFRFGDSALLVAENCRQLESKVLI